MKRMQVQDLVIRCRSVNTVMIEYVQGSVNKSSVYRSLTSVAGNDLVAEVLRFYIENDILILEVKPYGKE